MCFRTLYMHCSGATNQWIYDLCGELCGYVDGMGLANTSMVIK